MPRLDSRRLRELSLSGVAVSAGIQTDGTLLPVAGAFDKLLAAARNKSFPRLHTVVVAKDQPLADLDLVPDPQNPDVLQDPYAAMHVLCAQTIVDAVELLALDAQTRWGRIDCSLPARDPNFVGRARLMSEIQHFVATQESGYLVIAGGLGRGKSALTKELIHAAQARGEEPVYHLVGSHPSATGRPHNIVACLHARLLRKYVLPEPREWERLDVADRFERLLDRLSRTDLRERPAREILYLDAADQAQVSAAEPLLPGVLRDLPRGVFCVITSRVRLDWLKTSRGVTIWEMDDKVDDRDDVRLYLQRQARPLSNALVEAIVAQPSPPVFFTVAHRVRQLTEQNQPAAQAQALRADAALWVVPPEELIETESLQLIARADTFGLAESTVWRTLGLVAVAREPQSPEQFSAFGLARDGATDRILKLADYFFQRRPRLRQPETPYAFDHPGYQVLVLSHLDALEQAHCHRELAEGCLQWKTLAGEARRYALRHGPYHLVQAHEWDVLEKMLVDVEFLAARSAAGMVLEMASDLAAAFQARLPPERIANALVAAVQAQTSERYWLQLRSGLNSSFGSYSEWLPLFGARLEQSDNPNVVRFLADTLDMEERHDQAAAVFEKVRRLAEHGDDLTLSAACIRLMSAYIHLHEYQKAQGILDQLLSQPGASDRYGENYWWAQYHRGNLLHRQGHPDEAKGVFDQVRSARAGSDLAAACLHQMGIVDQEQGALDQAEDKFKRCLQERGDDEWNHRRAFDYRRLGQVYAQTNRLQEARAAFEQAIAISTRCGNGRYVRQTQRDIAAFVVAPYLKADRPRIVSLGELARRFGVDETRLAFAFRLLREEEQAYLQVVDAETGARTDQAVPWEIAHAEGAWHAGAMVLVIDREGRLAWQQRGEKDSRGKWDVSVGGHVDIGESDLLTAARETAEELGIRVASDRLVRVGAPGEFRKEGSPSVEADRHLSATEYVYRTNKTNRERTSVFLLLVSEEEKRQLVAGEEKQALDVKWATLEESAQAAEQEPSRFASAFKQIFGHPVVVERIRQAIRMELDRSH